jgi:hypothetical protein
VVERWRGGWEGRGGRGAKTALLRRFTRLFCFRSAGRNIQTRRLGDPLVKPNFDADFLDFLFYFDETSDGPHCRGWQHQRCGSATHRTPTIQREREKEKTGGEKKKSRSRKRKGVNRKIKRRNKKKKKKEMKGPVESFGCFFVHRNMLAQLLAAPPICCPQPKIRLGLGALVGREGRRAEWCRYSRLLAGPRLR